MHAPGRSWIKWVAAHRVVSGARLALGVAHQTRGAVPAMAAPRLARLARSLRPGSTRRPVLVWQSASVAGTRPGHPTECRLANRTGGSLALDFGSACRARARSRVSLAHAGGVHLSRYEKSRLAMGTKPCTQARSPQPHAPGALPGILVADAASRLLHSQWTAGTL